MNILYIASQSMNICDFAWCFLEMGCQVDMLNLREKKLDISSQQQLVTTTLQEKHYDFCLTNDFFGFISNACEALHIPYVSWNFDAPYLEHYSSAAKNPCNYIFTFDKKEYLSLKKLNLPHVYHLPLCANPQRVGALEITPEDEEKFSCDISFVGSMYEDNVYNRYEHLFPPSLRQTLENILKRYDNDFHSHLAADYITDDELQLLKNSFDLPFNTASYSMEEKKLYYDYLLSPKATELDRTKLLNQLAAKYSVDLYTTSKNFSLKNVTVHDPVSYDIDMNKVFYLSKINLNISFRQIASGIPQRIFDIMVCGGFVVTNNQTELGDYFIKGTDLEVFNTSKELEEIVDYYLHREKERVQIAINGYKKILAHHTYNHRANEILKLLPLQK